MDPASTRLLLSTSHSSTALRGTESEHGTYPSADDLLARASLPQFIPNARILTYGYDAYVARSCSPVSRTRVSDHAKDFLTALAHNRSENPERPLIFVAHSLGGIVCKDALLLSKNSRESHLRSVSDSTFAIAFMGTPHSGSSLAK